VLKIRFTTSSLALLALVWAAPFPGHSESVNYRGASFTVDTLTPVHPDQVTVSVGDSSFMVSEKDVGRRVALAYATDAKLAKDMPWTNYLGFLEKLDGAEDRDILEASAKMFLSSQELGIDERSQLSGTLMRIDSGGSVLLAALESIGAASQSIPVCMAIRGLDTAGRAAAKEKVPQVLLRHNAVCSEFLRKLARKHLSEGLVDESIQDLDVAISAFTVGPELDGAIVAARYRLAEMQNAFTSRDSFMYRTAFQEAAKDSFLADAFRSGRTAAAQRVAGTFLDEGRAVDALSVLTLIDFERRSESTHDLVLKALSQLGKQAPEVFKQERVLRVLTEFALKDESIKDLLVSMLDSVIGEDVARGDLSLAAVLLDAVRELRPDPSPQNDKLRFSWADRLLTQGQLAQAQAMIASASSGAPVMLRLNLLISSNPLLVLVSSATLIVCGLLLVFARRRSEAGKPQESVRQSVAPRKEEQRAEEGEEEHIRRARFVRYSPDLRGGGIRDEYADLLSVFGMYPGVKLSHIKNAYRNAVKNCHPDLNRNASSAEADRFIYLTQTYERLLQLHAERTGER
jgi:hypothetical protein